MLLSTTLHLLTTASLSQMPSSQGISISGCSSIITSIKCRSSSSSSSKNASPAEAAVRCCGSASSPEMPSRLAVHHTFCDEECCQVTLIPQRCVMTQGLMTLTTVEDSPAPPPSKSINAYTTSTRHPWSLLFSYLHVCRRCMQVSYLICMDCGHSLQVFIPGLFVFCYHALLSDSLSWPITMACRRCLQIPAVLRAVRLCSSQIAITALAAKSHYPSEATATAYNLQNGRTRLAPDHMTSVTGRHGKACCSPGCSYHQQPG